jgi:hypothetical protein
MRSAVVTASARSRPPRTCGPEESALSNSTSHSPATAAITAGPLPR